MNNLDWLWPAALQTLISIAIAVPSALWLMTTKVAEKILDESLKVRLETVKHKYATEIETLRNQLSNLADRGIRANEREFDSLTELWESFVVAYLDTNTAIMRIVSRPELNMMSEDELDNFLSTTNLLDSQKIRVRRATDKNAEFVSSVEWNHVAEARQSTFDLRMIIRKRGIFIPEDVETKYQETVDIMARAATDMYLTLSTGSDRETKHADKFMSEGDQVFAALQAVTRKRMFHA